MQFEDIEPKLTDIEKFRRFFDSYSVSGQEGEEPVKELDFQQRVFADGGYLDNRPFSSSGGRIVETTIGGASLDGSKRYVFASCYAHGDAIDRVCRTGGGSNHIFFELTDDIGAVWMYDCTITVLESGAYLELDGPSHVGLGENFTLIAELYAGFWEDLFVDEVELSFENGTVIDTIDVNDTFLRDTSESFAFEIAGITLKGEFTFKAKATTEAGPFDDDHTVKVGISDDTKTEGDDTTPSLTPGFESVIILLSLIGVAPLLRKYRS